MKHSRALPGARGTTMTTDPTNQLLRRLEQLNEIGVALSK